MKVYVRVIVKRKNVPDSDGRAERREFESAHMRACRRLDVVTV